MIKPSQRQVLKALGVDLWVRRSPTGDRGPDHPDQGTPVAAEVLAEAATPAPSMAVSATTPSTPPAPSSPPLQSVSPIRPALASELPRNWAGLRAEVKDCRRCKLCETRTQTVFGVGVEDAPLMVVGEGPGADEDAQGEPFVGRAGKLLDEMLAAVGRSRRSNVFIANVVKCRPPGNRDPEADEVDACRPYLEQQLRLVRPKLIVGLGRVAAQRLLQTDAPLSRLRGPVYHYGPEQTPLVITYHPAYLLRSPREKAKSWDDLKRIHRLLAERP